MTGTPGSEVDFAVVGAGLAGIRTAAGLSAGGASVTVFEARERVGGRVLSAPQPQGLAAGPPLVLDLGAQWVGPGQTETLRLIEELDLHVVPTAVPGRAIWDLDGRVRRGGAAFPPSYAGTAAGAAAPAWDNLQTFARDIIRATADAYFFEKKVDREKNLTDKQRDLADMADKEDDQTGKRARVVPSVARFVRGNLHEVVIVQTGAPLGTQAEDIADKLDTTLGGRVLLRSVQRPASTLEEWVRLPPLQRTERRARASLVVAVPEIGFSGDWFVHTGETSVFGIVAVPQWLRAVYPETAQFAGSWSPLLRLWHKRLQEATDKLRPDGARAMPPADLRRRCGELRVVEQQVRQHLSQINSEELCATLAYRQYLDDLLEAVGVGRLEKGLEAQLKSAEQLTDWYNENEQQRSTRRRDLWLFVIALLGVFSLADFMSLANVTDLHEKFGFISLTDNGRWEDWFILGVFGVLIAVAGFVLGMHTWLRRRLGAMSRRLASKLSVRQR
jgi:Flavin containing amine oxidoreductase